MDNWTLDDLRRMHVGGNKNVHKLDTNTSFSEKYKNTGDFVEDLDKLVAENKVKEPADSFMKAKKQSVEPFGHARVQKQRKHKFSDAVSSSEEEIKQVSPNTEKSVQKEIKKFAQEEEKSEEENLERALKPTKNLKKSVNSSRSPFSFTVKEIEESNE